MPCRPLVRLDSFVLCLAIVAAATPAAAQLSAEDELKALRPADGLQVELFAAEPLVVNPAAIDVDTQGRVWAAEIRFYRRAAKEPGSDRIVVLEDTDNDGRADRSTVFAEGIFCPMSICVAWPKVYVATSPDLWVYEDRDNNLVADGPPTKLLTGFGGHNHDHGAHSLVLGPDHKWWMSHGDEGFDVAGVDGSHVKFQWGATLRGELDGTRLETVAVNFRNPYEVCVSSFGEAYLSDNDNDGNFSTRICWLLEGGNYGWFGAPPARVDASIPFSEGWHFRAHIPGFVPGTLVTGFGSPCGICFYEGDALGAEYRDAPLHAEAGPRELRAYRHEPAGFGQRASSRVFMTSQGDDYFRPDDVCAAPDGTLFVSDWYDGGVGGHAYNNPTQGRIFVVRAKGARPARREKHGPYDNVPDAIVGLGSPNLATQFLARERLLADAAASAPALVELVSGQRQTNPDLAARALWVLDRLGGEHRQHVIAELKSDDARFRALAVRILRRHGSQYATELLPLAADESPEVRREVLLAIPKIEGDAPLDVLLKAIAAYKEQDRYELETLRIAATGREGFLFNRLADSETLTAAEIQIWRLLDPPRATEMLAAALTDPVTPPETKLEIVRGMAADGNVAAGRALLKFVADDRADDELRLEALKLIDENLQSSWRDLAGDAALAAALQKTLAVPAMRPVVLSMVQRYGVAELTPAVAELAGVAGLDPATRVQAIKTLAALRPADAQDRLAPLLKDESNEVRLAALDALVGLQAWTPVRTVLTMGPADLAAEAVNRCMSGRPGALVVLSLIDDDRLPAGLREAAVAAAAKHADSNVRLLFEKYLPPDARPVPLGSAIKPAEILALTGDPARGETIFRGETAQCAKCHTVKGAGGDLGPELSQIGRKFERGTLLETILEPSKAMAPEFVPQLVETDQGQVYVGFLIENMPERIVLKDADGKLLRLDAASVVAREPQQKSLMPELLLRDVTAQDAADLLAYLMSLRESVVQVGRFRILGPFDGRRGGVDVACDVEKQLDPLDFSKTYPGSGGQPAAWEVVAATTVADGDRRYPALDLVARSNEKKQKPNGAVYYLAVTIESPSDQQATLLVGSDDSCKLWVNGREVHRYDGARAVGYAQDRVAVDLRAGRNSVVLKVANGGGPSGAALAIESPGLVQVRAD